LKGVAVGKAPPGRLTALEQQVMLAMLHLAPQASGPAIIMYLMRKRQREQKPSPVYAALYRLRDWGYANAAPGLPTPKPGGRAKTLYSLTEAGLAGLQQSLQPGAKLRRTRSWAGSPLR
jgi:DNA-binding PadR family transcriptional regulator